MIPANTPMDFYNGDSNVKEFEFNFLINKPEELKVIHRNSDGVIRVLRLNIDYSINEVGNPKGSFINFPIESSEYSVLKEDELITLILNIPCAQTNPFGTSAVLNLNSLEYALDYIIRLIQLQNRSFERCMQVEEGTGENPQAVVENLKKVETNVYNFVNEFKTENEKANKIFEDVKAVQKSIEDEKNKQIDDIKATGFYLDKDEKLHYVINGEDKEFRPATNNLFDLIITDHILEGDEAIGKALQGTYIYKTAIAGERIGYPDFYNKCLKYYSNSETKQDYLSSNVNLFGSLIDRKGVLSSFSAATVKNYAALPQAFNPNTQTWEMQFKFNFTDLSAVNTILDTSVQYDGMVIRITTAGILQFYLSSNGTSWNVANGETGTFVFSSNTDYWVKAKFDGSQYVLSYSTDGIYFIDDISVETTSTIYNSATGYVLGSRRDYTEVLTGEINLNESYININGSRWWSGTNKYEYKQALNGLKFYDIKNKSTIDELFNRIGIADLYGVDTDKERIFLPRNKYFIQLTDNYSDVNKIQDAGLPNIIGSGNVAVNTNESGNNWQGAFTYKAIGSQGSTGDGVNSTYFDFNASNSNQVYGNSDTVQPTSSLKLLYYCVGTTVYTTSWIKLVEQVEEGVKDIAEEKNDAIQQINYLSEDYIGKIDQKYTELNTLSNKVNTDLSVATLQVNSAKEQANIAIQKANVATTQAINASISANSAEDSKNSALFYYNNSKSNADTSSQQALISTQQAKISTEKADICSENSKNSMIWAQGTDEEVKSLGGEHSAKRWAEITGEKPTLWGNLIGNIDNQIDLIEKLKQSGGGMPIGYQYSLNCTADYIPEGSLPCDGTEYNKGQFNDLWNNYLRVAKPLENGWNYKYRNIVNVTQDGSVNNGCVENSSFNFESNNWTIYFELSDLFVQEILNATISDTVSFTANIVYEDNAWDLILSADSNRLRINLDGYTFFGIKRENNVFYYKADTYSSWRKFDYIEETITENFLNVNVSFKSNIMLSRSIINNVYLASTLPEYYSLINTCTYDEYEYDLKIYGFCNKFGITLKQSIITTCSNENFQVIVDEDSVYENTNITMNIYLDTDGVLKSRIVNDDTNQTFSLSYYGLTLNGDASLLKDGDVIKISKQVVEEGSFKVPTAKSIERYLIKKKDPTEDDMSWYNLYSDGWCEQGAYNKEASKTVTVILPISYKDKYSYTITEAIGGIDNTASNNAYSNVYVPVDGSTFTIKKYATSIGYASTWETKGFVDLKQYFIPRQFVVVANGCINQSQMDWSEWYSSLKDIREEISNNKSEWVKVDVELLNVTAKGTATYTIDLSEFIPKGNQYEISYSLVCDNTIAYFTTITIEDVISLAYPTVLSEQGRMLTITSERAAGTATNNIVVNLNAYKKI